MVLLLLCTHISLLPLEDMQVSFNICHFFLSILRSDINLIFLELDIVVDVAVHRLLAASLGICRLPDVFQDRPRLTSIADSKDGYFASLYSSAVYIIILQ